MKLNKEQIRVVCEGLDDLKERLEEGLDLPETVVLTDALKAAGEIETESGPFLLTLAVEGEFVADPQEPDPFRAEPA